MVDDGGGLIPEDDVFLSTSSSNCPSSPTFASIPSLISPSSSSSSSSPLPPLSPSPASPPTSPPPHRRGTFRITPRMLDFLVDVDDGVLRLKNYDWDDETLEAIRFLDLDATALSECEVGRGVLVVDLSKTSVACGNESGNGGESVSGGGSGSGISDTTLEALKASFPNLLKIQFTGGITIWVPNDGGGVCRRKSSSGSSSGSNNNLEAAANTATSPTSDPEGTLTVTDAALRLMTDCEGRVRVDGREWGTAEHCVVKLKFDLGVDLEAMEARRRVKEIDVKKTAIQRVADDEKRYESGVFCLFDCLLVCFLFVFVSLLVFWLSGLY